MENKRIKVCKATVAWAAVRTERGEPVCPVLCPSPAAESLAQPAELLTAAFRSQENPTSSQWV